ncbi:NADP-dependent oxidoreductase [Chitiniphilus purpureus]|uniref:NADP-dependent oxidoreductase n=1 Tax=Chitiniphilus purpureus TaxID=2981137 RepID=A0ABY6DNX2_9NEIS|nr:NADP-dependent oxidoreductase [Chitiniphilus sp. CD1]UXY16070.1 NADP-dependent oxidoreductase [Chitiniphilus sp. CD1]
MSITPAVNRRILLAAHPQGLPRPADFRLDTQPVPTPAEGQVLLRTLYLSLDPYMRNLMDEIGPGYAPPIPLGAPVVGGTVNRVVASRHSRFQEGALVLGNAGWQDYALSDGSDLTPLGEMAQPSLALGGLGMPGFTAYVGLLDIGQPRPGETVVVGAATGAVGAVVGQLARLKGARAVGIASGPDKCRYAVETLGFDACLDRHNPHWAEDLAAACPDGIDVYFESVGGEVLDAVLPLLNSGARIPLCGFIAHYNERTTAGPDRLPRLLATLLPKRVRLQGFVVFDHYAERFEAFRRDMTTWVQAGDLTLREDMVHGLEAAPEAFIGLLQGRNFGKLVVRVAGD